MKHMKKTCMTLILALAAGFAFGHGEMEIGPNKGRILEFSDNESMHGELTKTDDGKLHIALLDKDMKPVKVDTQTLSATAGTREKPVSLEVAKDAEGFTFTEPGAGEWLIVRFKPSEDAKPVTARVQYDTTVCGECKNPEWLCSCH